MSVKDTLSSQNSNLHLNCSCPRLLPARPVPKIILKSHKGKALFLHAMLAVLFICQDPAHCFLHFPCNSAEWFHTLVTAGSTKPSSSWGLHRSTGGGEHLKPLREVKYKISWPLEAQQSPKISSLDAVSSSSPVQKLSALSSVTVRLRGIKN